MKKKSIPLYERSKNKNEDRRNREYLENRIKEYVDWRKTNNIPVYCGEFGLIKYCYEKDKQGNNRGGINWPEDVIDILIKNNIHFTYHSYHEAWFGIFLNREGLPDEEYANGELINLFIRKLGN